MKKCMWLLGSLLVTGGALLSQSSEKGWQNLFDGKTLKGWIPLGGKAPYTVASGAIVGTSVTGQPNSFLATEKRYGDFILELEFRLEDATINSGVQFRSHYDPAANDGRGRVLGYQYELEGSPRDWAGGIYDEGRRDWLYPMSLHPESQGTYRPGEFNHIRIECLGQTVVTWLNGKPMACLVDTAVSPGFIALQVHSIGRPEDAGKRIWWRNIRIRTHDVKLTPLPAAQYVVNTIPNSLTPLEQAMGWRLLFDGNSSKGWKGAYKPSFPEKGWEIADGELRVLPSGGGESVNGGDIVTLERFSAFDCSFEFNLAEGANSGVKYFVTLTEGNTGSAIGLEYQLLDDVRHPDAQMGRNGNRTLASLYDLIKADKQSRFTRPPGQWNTGRIVVYPDNRVEHYLNGIKVLGYVRGSDAYRQLVAESKYRIWPAFGEAPDGHILLQDHGDAVRFRSIRIRELK